jgi:glyoxylase-like metal-dependent hydrolase (beta-lactamase superfamily II)
MADPETPRRPQRLTLGDFRLTAVSGGRLWIDGGNMFGVVPRNLWARQCPPDEQNRIPLDVNCILVETPDTLGLIETGYGDKAAPKFRERHSLAAEPVLRNNLEAAGFAPETFDWVIFTHLHFDHAGGATYRDAAGKLMPTFPGAKHYVQRIEWEDATGDRPELAGSYYKDDFLPIAEAGLIELVEDERELFPGISVRRTPGHTAGHQIVRLSSGGKTAVYTGDFCPITPHLQTFWSMAYDQFPLDVRRLRPVILGEIADQGHLAIFGHDPNVVFATLQRTPRGDFAATAVETASMKAGEP